MHRYGAYMGRFGFAARYCQWRHRPALDPSCVAVRPRRKPKEWFALQKLAEEPFGQWLWVLSRSVSSLMLSMLILARYYRSYPMSLRLVALSARSFYPWIDCAITTAVLSYSLLNRAAGQNRSLSISAATNLRTGPVTWTVSPQQWGLLLEWHQRPATLYPNKLLSSSVNAFGLITLSTLPDSHAHE